VKNAAPSISPSRALARRRSHDDRSAPVRDRGDPRPAPGPPGGLRGSPWRRWSLRCWAAGASLRRRRSSSHWICSSGPCFG